MSGRSRARGRASAAQGYRGKQAFQPLWLGRVRLGMHCDEACSLEVNRVSRWTKSAGVMSWAVQLRDTFDLKQAASLGPGAGYRAEIAR